MTARKSVDGEGKEKPTTRRKKTSTTPKIERTPSAKSSQQTRVARGKPSLVEARISPAGELYADIAKRAYELYERRGWGHGNDLSDWLEAEQEILREKSLAKA